MKNLGSFHRRWRLEVAFVLVPFAALIVLQYVSNSRLARVEVIAHQSTLLEYLEAVAGNVRQMYERAADEMLDVPTDALATKRSDEIARHFESVDTSAASRLFAGSLDGCWCLTHYYDPETGHMGPGANPALEAVILRIGMLHRLEWMQHLNRSKIYVDELDVENRVVYRFVGAIDSAPVGFVGFVIDMRRFEEHYMLQAIAGAENMLLEDVRDNLIVRVIDGDGHLVAATHAEPGQADAVTGRFSLVFRDFELSARSRHTAAAHVLQSNALTNWVLSALMSIMAIGGVLLTWRAARRERRLSRIRSGFVTNVSHELRTPLASIAVFGEILRRGQVTATDKVIEYGHRIEQETTRLGYLINNVLSFGRIESAQVRYRREASAIEDVVCAALTAVDTRREQGGFSIEVTSPNTELPVVRVDTMAMTQVFVNLLDNAMKYSAKSRIVRVELRQCDSEVAVAIADAGIGIAPDDQVRIFHEFYRILAGNPGVAGTGLGLTIVQHIVRAHGGRIEVSSQLGHGATFTVLLPADFSVQEQAGVQSQVNRPQLQVGA